MSDPSSKPRPRFPRHYRFGGYRISNDDAAHWAMNVTGRTLHPVKQTNTIQVAIYSVTSKYHMYCRQVGEVMHVHWMLVTHSEPFEGYKDMDPSEIPQFEPGERDVIAKRLLDGAGIKDYEFATVLN